LKILFIQNRPLFPADTGGKIRTLNVLRHLAQWHEITYLCNVETNEHRQARSQMEQLGLRVETVERRTIGRASVRFWLKLLINLASEEPLSIQKNFDLRVRKRARLLVRCEPYDLVICDFLHTAKHASSMVGIPRILFQHNVEAQILQRHATRDGGGGLRRAYVSLQCRRTRAFESAAGRWFDAIVAVSENDRCTFQRDYGWQHVRTIDTAVDLDYFQPPSEPPRTDHCVFVGSLDWMPNADGVQWFVRGVWPQVRAAKPHATFSIVGRNPPAAISRLREVSGVEVIGCVPDVRPQLAKACIAVVPLHVGGGTRLKIFEAMAMGKAVVSTSLGAEGLTVADGKHLALADSVDQFAQRVIELMDNMAMRQRMGQQALCLVRKRFGAETIARQFEQICLDTIDAHVRVNRGRGGLDLSPDGAPSVACL
jgi:glycosyltransferase involved in cell wall biosynthesis